MMVESPKLYENAVMADDAMIENETADEEVNLRSDFAETAFFYPQLKTNEEGEILFSFTVPEQLTRWNFKGYAHSKEMGLGELIDQVVTVKDFSIQPYFPRFIRQGDRVVLSSVLTNQSSKMEKGTISFVLFDPFTEKIIEEQKQSFSVEANVTQGVSFTFDAPEEYGLIGCRIIAKGKTFSDGEQQAIPVLDRRISLIESETFIIRDESEVTVPLKQLFNENSPTVSNKKMTLEFSGNPTWLGIQALPSLQQPQSEDAVSWIASLYAGQVAAHILNSNPTIKTTLDAWQKQKRGTDDLLTPLLKNPELKSILLEESPWLLEAKTEEQQQARLQTLFNLNQVTDNRLAAELRLKELQQSDGSWSWFQGMNGNKFITSFVMETLIRLEKLTKQDISPEIQEMKGKAVEYLHREGKKEYERLDKAKTYSISNTGLSYLYLVALGELKVPKKYEEAYADLLSLVPKLLNEGTIAQKAKAAYVLNYNGKIKEAKEILASLKEYLVQTKEKGMYFSRLDRVSTQWDQQKIASHVYALEAFDEIAQDREVVNEMKLWLLSQKRTQQWNTPIETVNAVYALLCRG
ncbi:MAG: alpha-2-macroglobulin, partial [Bacteroidales bacterium]|nr:alpha-2-macroglobulin [Bacteroidales bacterium]